MDSVLMIRIISAILFVIVLSILIMRRRKRAA
jgi:hypothetical protein